MEWDMKMASWDLVELGRDSEHNIGSVVSGATSSGYLSRQKSGMDCSVDLKLGGLGDFSPSSEWKEQSRVLAAAGAPLVSPSGSSKRSRGLSNGSQNVSCLVDGCKSDLSNCREYHRRHKVCEAHSKTPMVLVGGQEQRFCQQCSRFHLLGEFDEVKRSCRKRLDGHNRRRRKPQPEPITSASLLSNLQGPRFSSYPHIFSTATPEPNWTSVVKSEEDAIYRHPPLHYIDRQQHFSSSYSRGYREGKHFPFLQENDASISSATTLEASVCQPLLNTISFSENCTSNGKMFSNGLPQVVDSDCALSLLSSPTQTTPINLGHIVPADRIPIAQPLVQNVHNHYCSINRYSRSSSHPSPTGFSLSGADSGQVGAILVSDAHDTDLQCQGFFHVGTEGSSEGHAHALPFSWQM